MKFDYPSGLILPFDTSCPSGWTRFTALDNLFAMGDASYGTTGGTTQHRHSINPGSRNTTSASGTNYNEETEFSTHSAATQTHVHPVDIPLTYTEYHSNNPPYIQVVFCKKD